MCQTPNVRHLDLCTNLSCTVPLANNEELILKKNNSFAQIVQCCIVN